MNALIEKRVALLNRNMELAKAAKSSVRPFSSEETAEIATNIQEAEKLAESIQLMDKITPAPVAAPAPSLIDGTNHTNFRSMRTQDGREVRCFGKGQRMADSMPKNGSGLDLDGFGKALAATITGNRRGLESECRALSENTNTAGGVFVTEELSAAIIDLARNKSRIFEAGAQTIDMNSSELRLIEITEDPTIALVGENALISSDDPAFRSRLLVARKHGVLVKCSNELLADGLGAGTAITNALASAWATYLDSIMFAHLFNEAGVGQTDTIGALSYDDLMAAQYAIRALNGEPTAAIMNSKSLYALNLLRDQATGSYLQPPAALAAMALLPSNAVADTHCIAGDFTQAVVGVRGGLSIELSAQAGDSFAYDQTWIRLLWRGDVGTLRNHFHVLDDLTY